MIKNALFFLMAVAVSPAFAQKVYKCSDANGGISFSNKPCADKKSREEVVKIRSQDSSSAQNPPSDATSASPPKTEQEMIAMLSGRWTFQYPAINARYTTKYYRGGRFESSGTDDTGSYKSTGKWSLNEKTIITQVNVVTTMQDGSVFNINTTNRSTIESMDANNLILKPSGSDTTSHWKR